MGADASDLSLVRRVQRGDKGAFDALVLKYQHKLVKLVMRYVRNPAEAEDIAQEAFIKAYRALPQFRGDSAFYTWLYRITVNLTIYSLRRNGHGEEVELNDAIPSSLPGPGVKYQRTEIREQVNAALAKLSPQHRAVVVLREVENLQYHEIAQVLNLSMGTVMSRLFYARKKLQSMLRPIYNQIYQTQPRYLCNRPNRRDTV